MGIMPRGACLAAARAFRLSGAVIGPTQNTYSGRMAKVDALTVTPDFFPQMRLPDTTKGLNNQPLVPV